MSLIIGIAFAVVALEPLHLLRAAPLPSPEEALVVADTLASLHLDSSSALVQ